MFKLKNLIEGDKKLEIKKIKKGNKKKKLKKMKIKKMKKIRKKGKVKKNKNKFLNLNLDLRKTLFILDQLELKFNKLMILRNCIFFLLF